MKKIFTMAAGVATIALPSAAVAQDAPAAEAFIGASAGYHDLDVSGDIDEDTAGLDVNTGSPIIGVVAGVDFPLGGSAFAGIEGNFHFGTDVIDSEYGASARLGFRSDGGAKYYLRGGYQVIDIDPYKIVDVDLPAGSLDDVDDTDGDFLVGVGADFPLGNAVLRFNLDTVSFDTVRGTAGIAFRF